MFFRELTGGDVGGDVGEEEDDQGEDGDAGRRVDARVGLHELPERAGDAGLVEAVHGDEHTAEEEEQRVGYLRI